mgnify:CR=1 FL=1
MAQMDPDRLSSMVHLGNTGSVQSGRRARLLKLDPRYVDVSVCRWQETTVQWPIMHAVTYDVSRDQMMARHKANHIQVVYAPNEAAARRACRIKAAALAEIGLSVHFCGNVL